MKVPKHLLAQSVIQLCRAKHIKHIIISPGSRSAPLTIGFTNHPYFETYSIVDERCAAFFALGMAQQSREPTALVCTSGSALLNYYPAVAEAFYSDIPLVVLSADRPAHLIGIGDGQTINPDNVYANHILASATLDPEDTTDSERQVDAVLNTCITKRGPVHINIPFDEPLYEMLDHYQAEPAATDPQYGPLPHMEWKPVLDDWAKAKRKMVLVGTVYPGEVDQNLLDLLAEDPAVMVFTEATSNIHNERFFPSIDKIIAPLNDAEFRKLQPEILLTFGGMIISKKVKAFLRNYPPKQHWHIDPKKAYDSFFCLNKHFKTSVNESLKEIVKNSNKTESDYQDHWQGVKQRRLELHDKYLNEIPFCDLKVFDILLSGIPDNYHVQLGNSSAVRYVQLFDVNPTLNIFCNRGTSGIDGSTSTAIGAALVVKGPSVFITGDLSFFYDSNALWNSYLRPDFRIILINNGGGGIFRILPGHKDTKHFDTFFETRHNLDARHLADMYGFEYNSCTNEAEMHKALNTFYAQADGPKILEIVTPTRTNDAILLRYFEAIA